MTIQDKQTTIAIETSASIVVRYQDAQKLSDAEMAEKVGVSRQTIWRWRTGDAQPSFEQLEAIVRQFGVHEWPFEMAREIVQTQFTAMQQRICLLMQAVAR